MPLLDFSEAQSISGDYGKIFIFNARTFSVYKVQGVKICTLVSTESFSAIRVDTFDQLFDLLKDSGAVSDFKYYFGDSALYVFSGSDVYDPVLKVLFKRKRSFKRVSNIGSIFDVANHHFPILIDYAEYFYASTFGQRATKETLKRIADFEDSLIQNKEPQ